MDLHQGIILGIVQGLTEFLPVSSSGHLVLGQAFFGMTQSQLVFDISVHMGTLLAVIVVYIRDILRIIRSVFVFIISLVRGRPVKQMIQDDVSLQMAGWIIAGSIPTALIGLALKQIEHLLFSSTLIVGVMLLVTGTILWLSKSYYGRMDEGPAAVPDSAGTPVGIKKSILIGIGQGLAVMPGISRSGTTIAAGLFLGVDRKTAAKFSFLLSIPAIVGAQILSIKDSIEAGASLEMVTVWATVAAFVTGLAALILLLKLVHAGRFHLFAPYCWILGALALINHIV